MPTDVDHAPFLLLSIRGEDAAADDEYQAMMRFAGLDENGMHRIRLTHMSLGPIDLDEWSGIILGGGPYNVSDPPDSKSPTQRRVESELLSLVDRIVDRDFPFLGCCYGVGMLGSVVGATVDRSYPEPVAAVTVTLTPAGRDEPLFADLPDVFDAFGGHKEAASSLPSACGLPRVVARLPRSGLPGRREHVCDAVPSRAGPRGHLYAESTSTRITATSRPSPPTH